MAQQIATGREDEPGLNQNGVSGINSPGGLTPGPAAGYTGNEDQMAAYRAGVYQGGGNYQVPGGPPGMVQRPGIFAPTSFQDAARAQQQALIDQLHGIASGKTYTPADIALLNSYNTAKAGAGSVTGNFRDVGAGAAARVASNQSAQLGNQQQVDAGVLKAQEQNQANALLAQLYNQQRGQDLQQAGQNANAQLGNSGLDDQANMANTLLQMGIDVRNTNQANSYARALLGLDQQGAAIDANKVQSGVNSAATLLGYLKDTGGSNQAQIDPNALSSGQYNYKKGGS